MWKSADKPQDEAPSDKSGADEPQEAEGKKSGKGAGGLLGKKLIIVIVAGLVLAGGGIGAATLLGGGSTDEEKPEKPKKVEAPLTWEFKDLTVNVYGTSGTRFLRCAMQVEVDSPKALDEMRLREIVFRDEIIEILQSKRLEELEYPAINSLKRQVRDRLNRMMTSGSVVDVYFSEFLIH